MSVTFKEEQKFTQWWVWLILVTVGVLPFVLNYDEFLSTEHIFEKILTDWVVIWPLLSMFGLIIMFLTMKLTTKIDSNGIQMTFFPFVFKKVTWNNIRNAEVVNYGFVGGWGIRFWTDYGTVYNIRGTKGVAIQLLNGKKFLIGTQKAEELVKVLKSVRSHGIH